MDNQIPSSDIQSEQPKPASQEVSIKKPRSKKKILLLILVPLLLICCGVMVYLLSLGFSDSPQVQQKLTIFLQYLSNEEYDNAYALCSKDFKSQIPFSAFTKQMKLFKPQYTGFKSQEQTGFMVRANIGQPTVYEYSGAITYLDGDKGSLTAKLVKEDGEWKILYVSVNISAQRLEKFQ